MHKYERNNKLIELIFIDAINMPFQFILPTKNHVQCVEYRTESSRI